MIAAFAVIRALHLASLMTVFGASALLFQARHLATPGTLRKPLTAAAGTALATAIAWLCFAAAEMTGDPAAGLDPHVLATAIVATKFGQIFFLRLALLIGLALLCLGERGFALKAAAAGLALALLGLTSHAAAADGTGQFYLRAGIDALHLVTAGFWVGGLAVLTGEVLAKPRDLPRLIALLRLFSRWGAPSVALLLAAGTANAVFILAAPMRWSGTYIALLAVKIVLAAVMVALALTNRFGVLPGLERREPEAQDTLPLTVVAELSCAVLILAIVGFLGLTAPMRM